MALENRTTAAVLAGYLLGRTEDSDLAATAGDVISRLNVSADPGNLAAALQEFVEASEKLSELSDDATDQLFEAVNNEEVQALAERFAEAGDDQDEDGQSEEEDPGEDDEEGETEAEGEDGEEPADEESGEDEDQGEYADEGDAEDEDEGDAEDEGEYEGEEEPSDEESDADDESGQEEDQDEEEAPRRKKSTAGKSG